MSKKIGEITLFTAKDIAEGLGIKERTIRVWLRKGTLKGRKVGKHWFVTEESLKDYLSGEEGGDTNQSKRK